MAQPASDSRATSRTRVLNRRRTSAATEPTAASLARFCAGIISSNVKRLRRRATVQPRRRRLHRQEDDRRTIEEVRRFAGNSGVGKRNHRCVKHRSRRQLEQAGRKRADAHHATAGGRAGVTLHACMIGIGARIVSHRRRHGTEIMTVTGTTLMSRGIVLMPGMLGLRHDRRHVRQAMQRHGAVAECKSGNRHDNAKGIQRDESARYVDPCGSAQPFQHPEPAFNNGRADDGRSVSRITVRSRRAQDAPGT